MKRVYVRRGARASYIELEWHNYGDVRYLEFGVASPYHHRWWATAVWIYLPKWAKIKIKSYRFSR